MESSKFNEQVMMLEISTVKQSDKYFNHKTWLAVTRNEKGFSLIELLIVMVILGLLASLVGPKLFGKLGNSKQHTAKAQIEMLMTAISSYRLDVGRIPSSQEGFEALVDNPGSDRWQGPYLAKDVPPDPWGNPYNYHNPGDSVEVDISSYGRDGQAGGEDEDADIVWSESGKWN